MKSFKQIQNQLKERKIHRVFGTFIKTEDDSLTYGISDIPEEELTLFAAVIELMRSGLEYQKILSKTNRFDNITSLEEGLNPKFINKFRSIYGSGKLYTFKKWIDTFADLLDELD